MKKLRIIAFIFFMGAILSCNSNKQTELKSSSVAASERETIPDTVVQFLIESASTDFRKQDSSKAIDFRNVKIGYIASQNNEKIFVLCGEFLSKEKNEWIEFTTIKTSGYEQYLGKSLYCQDATMVLEDENLSIELKNKIGE